MAREREDANGGAGPSPKPRRRMTAFLGRSPVMRLLVAVGIAAAALALAIVTDVVTASPRLCTSCHEIRARADSWSRSTHAGVECVKCHQRPRPWYSLLGRLADRATFLGGDVAKHSAGGYHDPVDFRVSGAPMPDAVCLQCHDPARKSTSGFRIIIDHPAHAKRNGSCVSCHVRAAHPLANRSVALTLMTACFACHGTEKTAKAPGRCNVCHPSGYELRPATHRASGWWGRHGKIARVDIKQCEMCHAKSLCDGCHGIDMPHPMGWAKGGHAVVAKAGRGQCMRCHTGTPSMCVMCHHKGFEPSRGSWTEQHKLEVEKRGAEFCLTCHSAVECEQCHVKQGARTP